MPDKLRVKFDKDLKTLVPAQGGTHVIGAPPAGFPVLASVKLRLAQDGPGKDPLKSGAAAVPARLEFFGKRKQQKPADYQKIGSLEGTIRLAGTPEVPLFKPDTTKTNNVAFIDYKREAVDVVTRSDFLVDVFLDRLGTSPTFDAFTVTMPFRIAVPWLFDPADPTLQLNVKLFVNGQLEADVDPKGNTPCDVPLQHKAVPEEGAPGNPTFDFFGQRTLYPRALDTKLAASELRIGGTTLNVFVHDEWTSFGSSLQQADLRTAITAILGDAGFRNVTVSFVATTATQLSAHWKRVDGRWMSSKIVEEKAFAAALTAGTADRFAIPTGQEAVVPFFDFFVMVETRAQAKPGELGHSERAVRVPPKDGVDVKAGTKKLATPIILANGRPGLAKYLSEIQTSSHLGAIATTICHEIGHSFGLRHGVTFPGNVPYEKADARALGVMSPGTLDVSAGPPAVPLMFFGPVHVARLREWYL